MELSEKKAVNATNKVKTIKVMALKNRNRVSEVVDIHMQSFTGFFLTFLGRGFLTQMYKGYIEHEASGLIVAVSSNNKIIGFVAFSNDLSGFYKLLVKKHLLQFVWYAFLGFLKKPKVFFRLLRALSYSDDAKKEEKYIELSSIGVLPSQEGGGVGSKLITALKKTADWNTYAYIKLETDAIDNEYANKFYQANGFVLECQYETREGRKMNEYRFYLR